MGRSVHTVLLCALLRHASVGSREQVQPPLPPPRRRPFWGGGRPLGSGGAEGRACGSPAGGGAGGGGECSGIGHFSAIFTTFASTCKHVVTLGRGGGHHPQRTKISIMSSVQHADLGVPNSPLEWLSEYTPHTPTSGKLQQFRTAIHIRPSLSAADARKIACSITVAMSCRGCVFNQTWS